MAELKARYRGIEIILKSDPSVDPENLSFYAINEEIEEIIRDKFGCEIDDGELEIFADEF